MVHLSQLDRATSHEVANNIEKIFKTTSKNNV